MEWSIEQISRNVHRLKFDNVKSGWEAWLMLSSDRHKDAPDNAEKLEREHLNAAKDRNAAIIDAGDLFDAMGGRYDPRRMQSGTKDRHKVDDYTNSILDEAAEFYGPYAEQFAVIGMGNHETAFLKNSNYNLTAGICRELKRAGSPVTPGGYGGYVLLTFDNGGARQTVKLKYYHGKGGGGPVTRGVIDTNRRAVMYPDADIVHTGHIHEAWNLDVPQERINQAGRQYRAIQQHICTPGYKADYGDGAQGWHIEKGMPPKPVGCYWLHLTYHDRRKDDSPTFVKITPIKDTEAW